MILRLRSVLFFAAAFFFLGSGTPLALVEGDAPLGSSLPKAEREALDTLALADERMRDAVLEAALHPPSIDNIAIVQRESSEAFRERLAGASRTRQKEIWDLVRYPDLVDALVLGGRPSSGAMDQILEPYPDEIREIARTIVANDFNLLNDVAHMRTEAERETANVIASLPVSAQGNFEALIERPDLMSALAENPGLVEHLGALYREDPFATREQFDRYHDDLTAEREQELAEWREAIEEDPDAQAELIESAEEFAQEEGYESPRDSRVVTERSTVHVYHHPYPYWFGTPHWNGGVTWYPHRAHWGFGFDVGGAFFAFGVPSPFYYSWHDRHHHRRAKYRHLDRRLRHHRDRHHARHRARGYRGHHRGDHRASHRGYRDDRGRRAGHNSYKHRKSDRYRSRHHLVRDKRSADHRFDRKKKRRGRGRDFYDDRGNFRNSDRKHARRRDVKNDARRKRAGRRGAKNDSIRKDKPRAREADREDRRRRDKHHSKNPRTKKRERDGKSKIARFDRERSSKKRSDSSKKFRKKKRKSKNKVSSKRDRSPSKLRKKGKSTARKRVAKRASKSSSKKKSKKIRSYKKRKKSGGGGRNFARRKKR